MQGPRRTNSKKPSGDILWTSNGRLYEVRTSYRRPLGVQRTSDAHWGRQFSAK